WIGTQLLSATSLAVDYANQKIYLTNGFSTADPRIVTRAIGPKVDASIEPYVFSRPPTARVYGIIPIASESDADLHFDLDGGPFHWLRFNLEHVTGHIDWKGQHLALRNVRANLYGGYASGSAEFDFRAQHGTAYRFDLITTNAQLKWIMADLSTHTNNLEGMLNGTLVVNSANSADWRSWQGAGDVNLQDGLIWEIPAFGLFSPILNSIAPGLGNSRASAGTGTFMITNGVVYTDDLEIRTSGARLDYRGTVDFQGQLNARVDAQLLRDIWGIGPLISTVFWPVPKLFEYKVTGPLSH